MICICVINTFIIFNQGEAFSPVQYCSKKKVFFDLIDALKTTLTALKWIKIILYQQQKNLRRWKTIKNVNFNKIQYFFELILIFNLFYKKIKKYLILN
jgi:hypothetical protein